MPTFPGHRALLPLLGALLAAGAVAALALASRTTRPAEGDGIRAVADRKGKPRNVILLIGDGMGTQEITAARYYRYGAAGRMNVDRLPFTGFDTNWSVKPGTGRVRPDYAPDSAATGTQWATGRKTIDGRISQGRSSGLGVPGPNHQTVLERAQKAGKRVGNVTTADVTDATPAVLASHISLRICQGPADTARSCPKETKAAGGPGSIAEQEVDHRVDVLLGGGAARFAQTITGGPDEGRTVLQSARRRGYRHVTTAAGLDRLADLDKPVLGLFAPGDLATEYDGPTASRGSGFAPSRCDERHRPAGQPSLAAMTRKAISLLGQGRNRKGFFLQVEGASIDKQDHAANPCAQIGETVAFDRAVGVALAYQRTHPDTLIVVTADHAHTSQIVAEESTGQGNPTGYSGNVITRDGQTMRLTYGTAGGDRPPATPPSQQHTGSVVPVWAGGPTSSAVSGTHDHTDLFSLLSGEGGR